MPTAPEFLAQYAKAKVWADLDDLVKQLDLPGARVLCDSLQTVKDYTGLDMRQEFLLGVLNSMLKYHTAR